MKVKCPRCGKETPFEGNPFRPFCCERCRLIDLGSWISEAYRVPARSSEEEGNGIPELPEESTES